MEIDIYKLAKLYAPRVWLHSEEEYFPSSVNYYFENSSPIYKENNGISLGISNPRVKYGQRNCFTNNFLSNVTIPSYVFKWNGTWKGPRNNDFVESHENGEFILTYYFFYPYNLGKRVFFRYYGNHDGDVEKIRILFQNYKPVKIFLSIHGHNEMRFAWGIPDLAGLYANDEDELNRNAILHSFLSYDSTHPIIYSAKGSHGSWPQEGNYKYGKKNIPYIVRRQMIDSCDKGYIWDIKNNIILFDVMDWIDKNNKMVAKSVNGNIINWFKDHNMNNWLYDVSDYNSPSNFIFRAPFDKYAKKSRKNIYNIPEEDKSCNKWCKSIFSCCR